MLKLIYLNISNNILSKKDYVQSKKFTALVENRKLRSKRLRCYLCFCVWLVIKNL